VKGYRMEIYELTVGLQYAQTRSVGTEV